MMYSSLIARLTASFRSPCCNSTQFQLGFLLRHNAFLFFNSVTSGTICEPKSKRNLRKGDTFTVSYLTNSCGLSPESAMKLSKKVNLKNPDGPNAVLALLKNYGFSETQITKLVEKRPVVLAAKADTTLLPKLKFFRSIGMSTIDLPKIIIHNDVLLQRSVDNCLMPRYEILRGVVRDDEEAIKALKHGPRAFLFCNVIKDLVLNINVLRQLGVTQTSISCIVSNFPSIAYLKHFRFVEAVKTVKEMGFDPSKTVFVLAVQVFAIMTKATWKSKLDLFERYGWSREISLLAFRKYPQYMVVSEKKVMKTLRFLMKDMGWLPEEIASCPAILNRNLEKTLKPRCAVIRILKSRGLIKNDLQPSSFILLSEKKFLKRYVTRFPETKPLLLDAYKGQKSD